MSGSTCAGTTVGMAPNDWTLGMVCETIFERYGVLHTPIIIGDSWGNESVLAAHPQQ
jgi:hypothetical protein